VTVLRVAPKTLEVSGPISGGGPVGDQSPGPAHHQNPCRTQRGCKWLL